MIKSDFQSLIDENQWLMELVNGINEQDISPVEIYKLFMNFTAHLTEFQQLKSRYEYPNHFFLFLLLVCRISILLEKYFWALPDESMQKMALSIRDGLNVLGNLSTTLYDNLKGCKSNLCQCHRYISSFSVPVKDVFQNLNYIKKKLRENYHFPSSTIQLFEQGRLFKDPIVSLDLINSLE